ncbi:molybdopterin cofactor-binding domain-containing protein [Humitalea sp. 24SJ18S-53]|uniref:xanthine dehydrogenase family protein molybdopterin-binding subunit n=1 Tax=Humitalea sp. 24SJ18S-53 TaxID=3422307 RepID=UPI003D66C048
MRADAAVPPKLPGSLEANRRLSQWLHLSPDGRVVVTPGKVEIGQGILTALAQIAADELDVAYRRVSVTAASTATSPNEGVTSGSRSVQDSGLALRHVCAAARAIHLAVVAQRSGVPVEALRVQDGTFLAPDGRAGGSYWSEARSGLLDCDAPPDVAAKPPGARRIAGTAAPRLDLPDKVFGAQRYIHDLRLPGMRFARVLRPPSRNARLVGVPDAPEGVALIVDGSFLALACDTEGAAEAAATRLAARARWEEQDSLPPAAALPDRLRAGPVESTTIISRPRSPSAAPGTTLRATFFRPYLAHGSIGLSCAIARWSGDGMLEVWSHSQNIFGLRRDLAMTLGLPVEQVTVHHREAAGCYGHNGADDVALDAALVARALPGAPVRLRWSRADELSWAPFAPAMLVEVEAETAADGRLLAWRQDIYGNGHLSRPGMAAAPSLLAASHLAAPFDVPPALNPPHAGGGGADRNGVPPYDTGGLSVQVHRWLEMPLRTSSFRALGAMANVLATESVMDELAAAAGRDPVAYRLAHLADPRARAVIEAVVAMAGPQPMEGRGEGTGRGLGYARYKGTSAWCAVIAEVEAEAQVKVRRLWLAVDAGEIVNPEGAAHQIEGGAIQAVSIALKEAVTFDARAITSNAWDTYPILRFSEVPAVDVRLMDHPDQPPLGVGECATGPTVAAIANAIHDALGVRVRNLPFTADAVAAAMG